MSLGPDPSPAGRPRASALAWLVPAAGAADLDADGWDETTDDPPDCGDDDAYVHPNAPENGVDAIDRTRKARAAWA